MVRLALESIKMQGYKNWELAFIDDGSEFPGRQIAEEILSEDIEKIKFFNSNNTPEEKYAQGGSIHGLFLNKAMENTDADIAVILCDDDALYPNYLENLNKYYTENPEVNYSYGHVSIFNPNDYTSIEGIPKNTDVWFNNHVGLINPSCNVDASQVSWRIAPVNESKIRFPFPQTGSLDAALYDQLFRVFGPCPYNNMITEYKGWHDDRLEHHKETPFTVKDN